MEINSKKLINDESLDIYLKKALSNTAKQYPKTKKYKTYSFKSLQRKSAVIWDTSWNEQRETKKFNFLYTLTHITIIFAPKEDQYKKGA